MYRLANFKDATLQRIVSNEMAAGFIRALELNTSLPIPIEYIDPAVVRNIFNLYSHNKGLHNLGEEALAAIILKIKKMYIEILDTSNEYTFDEFGEYILYLFIYKVYSEFLESDDYCDDWTLSAPSVEDYEYMHSFFKKWYDNDVLEDDTDLLDDENSFIYEHIARVSEFACMSECTDYFSAIFWDEDFKLYDSIDTSSIFADSSKSKYLGLSMCSDERHEPLSGSFKYPLS